MSLSGFLDRRRNLSGRASIPFDANHFEDELAYVMVDLRPTEIIRWVINHQQ